ncbi:MAG TPA: glycosyltransferase family 39 protein [Longimicrobium sp.]
MSTATPPTRSDPQTAARDLQPRDGEPASGRGARVLLWLTVLGVCAGAGLRIWLFLRNQSQYYDELMLSLNVAMRSYGELLQPLRPEQVAPPLFLWAQRLMVDLFGVNDLSLRIVPVLGGIAVPAAAALAGRRLGGWGAACLCAWATALNPNLLFYSLSGKPYGQEPLVAAGIVLLTAATLRDRRRWPALLLAGCVAALWCIPVPFILAGAGAALAVDWLRRPDRRRALAPLAAMAVAWAGTFAIVYLTSYRDPQTAAYLRRFWAPNFPANAASVHDAALLFVDGIARPAALQGPLAMVPIALYLALCALGAWDLLRRLGAAYVALLAVPVLGMYAAWAAGQYPLEVRLVLFALPLHLLLVALGVTRLGRALPRRAGAAAVVAACAVLAVLPLRNLAEYLRVPQFARFRQSIAYVAAHRAPGEPVYVSATAMVTWLFYTTDWRQPETERTRRIFAWMAATGPNSGNMPSRHAPVVHEGYDRVLGTPRGPELFGVATGSETFVGSRRTPADPGWGENETDRIRRAAGGSTAWVLLRNFDALDAALRRGGAVEVDRQDAGAGFTVLRVRFPRPRGDG